MKKVLQFLFLFAGTFAAFGVLFLLIRTDAVPAGVRSFSWRTAIGPVLNKPVEEEAAAPRS